MFDQGSKDKLVNIKIKWGLVVKGVSEDGWNEYLKKGSVNICNW